MVITKGETGGAQSHVLTLCGALARQFEFAACIGGSESTHFLADGLRALGVPVVQLPQLGNSLSPWRVLGAVRALVRLLRQQRPDVIHAHSAVAGVVARLAGWRCRIPVLYTVHGFGFKPEVPRLQRWAAWAAEWTLARLTRHMICVSDHERQLALSLPLPAQRLSVIRNAVPDTPERADPAAQPVRVVMVARLASPKRPDLLLQALALLRDDSGAETPASLIGAGPQMDALRALARQSGLQQIDFCGDVSDVPQRLARHAVFVLMSDHEGLPISVIEAMRAGLAVVASDLPGVRELLADGQAGLLIRNDARALADALAQLLSSAPLRARLGQAARAQYEAHFTPDQMALPVATIYQTLAHGHH